MSSPPSYSPYPAPISLLGVASCHHLLLTVRVQLPPLYWEQPHVITSFLQSVPSSHLFIGSSLMSSPPSYSPCPAPISLLGVASCHHLLLTVRAQLPSLYWEQPHVITSFLESVPSSHLFIGSSPMSSPPSYSPYPAPTSLLGVASCHHLLLTVCAQLPSLYWEQPHVITSFLQSIPSSHLFIGSSLMSSPPSYSPCPAPISLLGVASCHHLILTIRAQLPPLYWEQPHVITSFLQSVPSSHLFIGSSLISSPPSYSPCPAPISLLGVASCHHLLPTVRAQPPPLYWEQPHVITSFLQSMSSSHLLYWEQPHVITSFLQSVSSSHLFIWSILMSSPPSYSPCPAPISLLGVASCHHLLLRVRTQLPPLYWEQPRVITSFLQSMSSSHLFIGSSLMSSPPSYSPCPAPISLLGVASCHHLLLRVRTQLPSLYWEQPHVITSFLQSVPSSHLFIGSSLMSSPPSYSLCPAPISLLGVASCHHLLLTVHVQLPSLYWEQPHVITSFLQSVSSSHLFIGSSLMSSPPSYSPCPAPISLLGVASCHHLLLTVRVQLPSLILRVASSHHLLLTIRTQLPSLYWEQPHVITSFLQSVPSSHLFIRSSLMSSPPSYSPCPAPTSLLGVASCHHLLLTVRTQLPSLYWEQPHVNTSFLQSVSSSHLFIGSSLMSSPPSYSPYPAPISLLGVASCQHLLLTVRVQLPSLYLEQPHVITSFLQSVPSSHLFIGSSLMSSPPSYSLCPAPTSYIGSSLMSSPPSYSPYPAPISLLGVASCHHLLLTVRVQLPSLYWEQPHVITSFLQSVPSSHLFIGSNLMSSPHSYNPCPAPTSLLGVVSCHHLILTIRAQLPPLYWEQPHVITSFLQSVPSSHLFIGSSLMSSPPSQSPYPAPTSLLGVASCHHLLLTVHVQLPSLYWEQPHVITSFLQSVPSSHLFIGSSLMSSPPSQSPYPAPISLLGVAPCHHLLLTVRTQLPPLYWEQPHVITSFLQSMSSSHLFIGSSLMSSPPSYSPCPAPISLLGVASCHHLLLTVRVQLPSLYWEQPHVITSFLESVSSSHLLYWEQPHVIISFLQSVPSSHLFIGSSLMSLPPSYSPYPAPISLLGVASCHHLLLTVRVQLPPLYWEQPHVITSFLQSVPSSHLFIGSSLMSSPPSYSPYPAPISLQGVASCHHLLLTVRTQLPSLYWEQPHVITSFLQSVPSSHLLYWEQPHVITSFLQSVPSSHLFIGSSLMSSPPSYSPCPAPTSLLGVASCHHLLLTVRVQLPPLILGVASCHHLLLTVRTQLPYLYWEQPHVITSFLQSVSSSHLFIGSSLMSSPPSYSPCPATTCYIGSSLMSFPEITNIMFALHEHNLSCRNPLYDSQGISARCQQSCYSAFITLIIIVGYRH